jgi:hypothetical protein
VKKYGKQQKKVSGSIDLFRKSHVFLGQALYKGKKKFSSIYGFYGY